MNSKSATQIYVYMSKCQCRHKSTNMNTKIFMESLKPVNSGTLGKIGLICVQRKILYNLQTQPFFNQQKNLKKLCPLPA